MTTSPDTPSPSPDDLAAQLQDALREEGAVDAIPADQVLADLRRRSARRHNAKVGVLACAVAVLLMGSVLTATVRARSSEGGIVLADQPAGGTSRAATTTSGAGDAGGPPTTAADNPCDDTTSCPPATDPPEPGASTTTGTSSTTSTPPDPVPSSATTTPPGCALPAPTTIPGTCGPDTTVPDATSTTVPEPTGQPKDCGSRTPSGYPTTAPMRPGLEQCLLEAFVAGTPAVFHLSLAGATYPDTKIWKDFTVVGVRLVEVKVDRTLADSEPRTVVTYRCSQLTANLSSADFYVYGGCTTVA